MELYRWQRECLAAWERAGYRGIVRAVTGAGKTVLALRAIDALRAQWPELRVKVVVPTIPLAEQWKTALLHAAPGEDWRPGFFGGGVRDEPDRRVMIYILNSARASLAAHMRRELSLDRHVLLLCDECHHCQSPQNRHIFDFLSPDVPASGLYACLGLSATPFGTANDGVLTAALGREIYRYGFGDAAREGVLSPFFLCEVAASFLPEEAEQYAALTLEVGKALQVLLSEYPQLRGLEKNQFLRRVSAMAARAGMDPEEPAAAFLLKTYARRQVSALAYARIRCGLAIVQRLSPDDRVLVFCERIAQARQFAAALRRRWGGVCGLYHSELTREARRRAMEEFRDHRTRILVSCRCLDEGLDVPDANIGIVLSSSAVERQRVQRLGRVIRTSPGKDAACLYYIYIRESVDDAAYLPGLADCRSFSLRYYTAEDAFSNDLYEYAAQRLLRNAAQRGMTEAQLAELRACLLEGLSRSDYLLAPAVLRRRAGESGSVHARNYWNTMKRMRNVF